MTEVTTRSELPRFVHDLRWIVPLWLVMALGFGVYAAVKDGARSGLELGGGMVVLGVALAPLVWVRWNGRRPRRPGEIGGALKRIGLACGWAAAVLIALFAIASAVD